MFLRRLRQHITTLSIRQALFEQQPSSLVVYALLRPCCCIRKALGWLPAGFMLQNPDDAVIWRGPRKNALIKQFLKDVDWGSIDYLVVDAPPG